MSWKGLNFTLATLFWAITFPRGTLGFVMPISTEAVLLDLVTPFLWLWFFFAGMDYAHSTSSIRDTYSRVYYFRTKNRAELLTKIMQKLVADNAAVSFEGRHLDAELLEIPGGSSEETDALRRTHVNSDSDFLVLPLRNESLPLMEKAIRSKHAFGKSGIAHVQIEKDGVVVFTGYESTSEDYLIAYSTIPSAFLDKLVRQKILYGYEVA